MTIDIVTEHLGLSGLLENLLNLFFSGMTDTITIVNYRNMTTHYHYHYRYFQMTDSGPIVGFKLNCSLICFY